MPLINELYCFAMLDKGPDDEGVPCLLTPTGPFPLMGADTEHVESMMAEAQKIANHAGKEIRIYKFTQKEQIGVITPVTTPSPSGKP